MRSELWLSLVLLAACAEGGTSEDGMRADGGPVDGSTEDAGRVDGGRTDGGGGTGSCAREGDPCDAQTETGQLVQGIRRRKRLPKAEVPTAESLLDRL